MKLTCKKDININFKKNNEYIAEYDKDYPSLLRVFYNKEQ